MRGFARWGSLALGALVLAAMMAMGVTREVPLGSIEGVVVMEENGRPLKGAQIWANPADSQSGLEDFQIVADDNGEFSKRHIPAGQYTLHAYTRAHNVASLNVRIEEGKTTSLELSAKPSDPFLEIYRSQMVVLPKEKPSFELHGFGPANEIGIGIYRLDPNKLLAKGTLYQALSPLARTYGGQPDDPATVGKMVGKQTHKIQNRDFEGVFVEMMTLDQLPEGLYWVACRAGTKVRGAFFNVTHMAVVTKSAGQHVEALVSDIETGQPIADAELGWHAAGVFHPAAKSDAQGRATIRMNAPQQANAGIVASKGTSLALVDSLYVPPSGGEGVTVYLYSERPVYRPGDEVFFKGVVRRLNGSDFEVPAPGTVAISIQGPDQSILQESTTRTSPSGSFFGSFKVNREAMPGLYQVTANFGGAEKTLYVNVAAYRKPELEATLTPTSPFFIRGSKGKMNLECQYYFGGPVADAEVNGSVYRIPLWRAFEDEGEDSYDYDYGEYVGDIEAQTDAQGRAVVEFDTVAEEDDPESVASMDYTYRVEAYITGPDDKSVQATGRVLVVRGDYDVRVEPVRYMAAPGEEMPIQAVVRDHKGKPIVGQTVTAVYESVAWGTENEEKVAKIGEATGKTDPTGTVDLMFVPDKAGDVRVTVTVQDSKRRAITATTSLWVTGLTEFSSQQGVSLAVLLDKRQYKKGETAKAMIRTDKPGGMALFAVEADKMYDVRAVRLDKPITVVEIPVVQNYAPNVFVSVAYVRGKTFTEASRRLAVDIGSKRLDVRVKSDVEVAEPGQTITYQIETLAEGKPVPAEASIGVVDESVYAIKADTQDIVEGFYPKRQNQVTTLYSFPELYLDGGDKAPANVTVRRVFKDTAFWQPVVPTGPDGKAEVKVTLPDNLTQWRATVVAATPDAYVGQNTTKLRSRKPLMVRLSGPRVLVEGDEQQLSAVIANSTGKDQRVHLSLEADGTPIGGDLTATFDIPNGKEESVRWTMQPDKAGLATFVAKAWIDGGPSDGVELKIPIKPFARLMQFRSAGEVKQTTRIPLEWSDESGMGSARLTITPGIDWALVQALDGLIDFPYGCVEQTMSRFVPAVVADTLVKFGKLKPFARQKEIPEIVADSYARLQKMQNGDGGWGWWSNDQSDPYITGLVLEGLAWAKDAGRAPNPFMVSKALNFVGPRLRDPNVISDPQLRVFSAYAVALHGPSAPASDVLLQADVTKLNAGALAAVVIGCHRLGPGHDFAKNRALDRLLAISSVSGGLRSWKEEFGYGSESTARAMLAIGTVAPNHPALDEASRYLMFSRKGTSWFSTRDTSLAALALAQRLGSGARPSPGQAVTVKVNGRNMGVRQLGSVATGQNNMAIEIPTDQLNQGANEIVLETKGDLYWALETTQHIRRTVLGEIVGGALAVKKGYHLIRVEPTEDGRSRPIAEKKARTVFNVGDAVECSISLKTDKMMSFLILEDAIPSGWEVVQSNDYDEYTPWNEIWSELVVRDDRVALFIRFLPEGVHTVTYTLRPETPGTSKVLPVSAYCMYEPDVRAGSSGTTLEVRR